MTKWNLPEGRKPMTDEDLAALTRRLAGTAIDYKEMYYAAKRDAEEAEAYVAELDAKLQELLVVSKRAIRLSMEHPDFKLYAMEPMHQAIAAAELKK